MKTESLNPAAIFIQCPFCLTEKPDDETPQDYARQSVGVTNSGDLVIWCQRHDNEIAIFKNGTIDGELAAVANLPCKGCGHSPEEEVGH